jgi:predicted transcriptional regulator
MPALSSKHKLLLCEFISANKYFSIEDISEKLNFSKKTIENICKKEYIVVPSKMNKKDPL